MADFTELSQLRQELATRFDGVDRRFDTVEERFDSVREQVASLRESRAAQAGGIRIGAWVADGGRMLAASAAGALLGWWLLLKPHGG